MRYKAILFDMDGTLLDTLTDMEDAVNHILSVHGWPLRTTEEVRAFVGNGARRLMERAVPPEVTNGDFEAVLTEYRDWYQTHNCVATAPYPGIPALLAALAKAGIKTAVVSNKPDRTTRTLAARFFPELDGAMGQREGIASKPAPAAKPDGDPSKGPYAPPIALEGEALSKPPYAAPLKATGADPDQEPPYAPPLLASASQGVPGGAVLWRVVVTSGGSKGNTYEILPQLATAAAQAVGKNMQADVFVDSDMRVTFGK